MLNFVIGTAGTGKSRFVTEKIVELAGKGEKCLLLVPEQFSKTGETLLYSALDETGAKLVDLFSFTSLMRDVNTNFITLASTPLSEAGKAVLARRAVNNVKNHLNLYSRQAENFGFSFNLADTFGDLKRSGINRRLFYDLAQKAPERSVKLKELALIYGEYSSLLGRDFADSEDLYLKLGEILPSAYTENTNVFIDGFESFSHGQLKIIEKLLTDSKSVTVALTCDSLYDTTGGTGNFSFVQSTAQQLIKIAKNNQITISAPTVMRENHRFAGNDLKNIDLFLQGGDREYENDGSAFVTEFETQRQEVAFTAAKIHRLIKEGYTYNDITVVCPQLEKYENRLQDSFTLARIPYFIDTGRIISSCGPVVLFKSIFRIISEGMTGENIMPLLKTGLTEFDDDVISQLENYLYVWQDYKFDLSLPFEFSPGGLKAAPEDEEKETLMQINGIREKLWEIFAQFKDKKSADSTRLLTGCYEIAIKLGAAEKLISMIENLSTEEDKQLAVRQWDTAIECLDSLYRIVGGDEISAGDMETLFSLMVEGVTIGFAPRTQDCVIITDPKRMKLDRVKAVFILGAAQDIFPGVVAESGLITTFDRRYLKENNYPLKNNFENLFSFENLYYYKALTSAGEKLFISVCKKNIDLRQMLSRQVDLLRESLNLPRATLELEDYGVTKEFFADYVSGLANNLNRQSYIDILHRLGVNTLFTKEKQFEITDLDLLEKVLGNSLTLSPTGVQNYFQCAFMYFLQRVLKVKPLEKAEFSARVAGNYLHFIAQQVMEKYGEDYYKADWGAVLTGIDKAMNRFIEENYPPQIANDTKFTAQYENMKANAVQLLEYIRTEQTDGMFRPIAFEEKIGMGGRVPPLTVTREGKRINVVGVADRIDIFRGEDSDYLRIIDYKTGNQKFNLDEIYNGLSSQLLLYMNALLESGFAKGDKPLKAGAVVYQPSDAAFKFDKDDEKLYTAVGMALSNPEISAAFDKTMTGRYGVIRGEDNIKSYPGSEVVGEKKFGIILDYVKDEIKQMAKGVWSGDYSALPLGNDSGRRPCDWCPYKAVCRGERGSREMVKNQFDKMEKEGE